MKRQLFKFGVLMVVLFTFIYVVGGVDFLRLLTDEQRVIAAASPYLIWVYLIPLAGVAAFVYDGIFIGITETKGMLVTSVIAMLFFFVFYFIAEPYWANNALWIAFLMFLALRGLFQYFWAKQYIIHS